MKSRAEKAVERKLQGYNCAQALVCTYSDLFGMEEEIAYKMAEAFGSGIGGLQHICGAASGAFMLAGLANSDGILASKQTRSNTYQIVKEMACAFEKENQYLMCSDILRNVTEDGKRIRTCEDCIYCSAKIVEEVLLQKL